MNHPVWLAHGIHFSNAVIVRLGRHVMEFATIQLVVGHLPNGSSSGGAAVGISVDGSASNDRTGAARRASRQPGDRPPTARLSG
jgi:hypothetical protein